MTADHLIGIEQFEADLWKVADNLRANSNLASNEYFMPILGLIFLRHATNRYYAAMSAIEADKAAGAMSDRPLIEADFTKRRALMLPDPARYDVLLAMPKDGKLGAAVTAAMEAVEDHFPPLAGQLPKDYERFEDDVLEEMMRTFDSQALRTASGDVFGRIYEYFLAEFSKQGAHDNGEFFTPPSIVQTIVNVIEPDHGVVLDPACGSGGMFVQSSHFIEDAGEDAMKRVTFYGHEKNETTAKLAQVNLAVHGLEGRIRAGNEAITYYKDPHELAGKCDFVMANPPFNVDEVDAGKVKGDRRLPFGLPGVNKAKKVSNANYLWLQYFYSYLNENGRAGVVMSSQASSAGRDEARVRRKLVESGAVDVMIDIRGNFFYTRTVPCQLWFFDRAKERDPERAGRVLMLDARSIHRKVSRAVYDFSPEQQKNIAAIVWLYRGRSERFLALVESYLARSIAEGGATAEPLAAFEGALGRLVDLAEPFATSRFATGQRDPGPACRALGGAHLRSSQGIRRLCGVHRRSHAVRRRLERMERGRQRRGARQPRPPRGARKPARHGGALPEPREADRSGREARRPSGRYGGQGAGSSGFGPLAQRGDRQGAPVAGERAGVRPSKRSAGHAISCIRPTGCRNASPTRGSAMSKAW